MFMNTRKPRVSEEGFPPGAKLVWDETVGRLVLQVPKKPKPATAASSSTECHSRDNIDRILAGAPKD
jgi:hypothetical protein